MFISSIFWGFSVKTEFTMLDSNLKVKSKINGCNFSSLSFKVFDTGKDKNCNN